MEDISPISLQEALSLPDTPINTPEQGGNVKLATKCSHPDRPVKGRGMCQPCYRAALKAEQLAGSEIGEEEEIKGEGEITSPAKDFSNDTEAADRFVKIMWEWVDDVQRAREPIISIDSKGKPVRDFKLEARRLESASALGMKAATVLARAYIVEKKMEEKPQTLQIEGADSILSGWVQIAEMGREKGKKK